VSGKRRPRRTPEAAGYRAPARAEREAPARRGILDSVFTPRTALGSPLPPLTRSVTRGFVTVISTPAILAWVAGVLLVGWIAVVALGFQGPFGVMSGAVAWPGPGTLLDQQLASLIFGPTGVALFSIFALLVVRGVVLAVLTTMCVERMRSGTVSGWSFRRALRVLPVALSVNMVGLASIQLAQILASFLGSGLGLFAFIAALVLVVWLTGPALAVAADEDRSLSGAMQRGFRFARVPGSGAITAATLYAFPSVIAIFSTVSGRIGVNPTIGAWAVVLGVNLLHVVAVAMWAYRYLAGAPFVDEAPPVRRGRGG
jgi:hypothetical protein